MLHVGCMSQNQTFLQDILWNDGHFWSYWPTALMIEDHPLCQEEERQWEETGQKSCEAEQETLRCSLVSSFHFPLQSGAASLKWILFWTFWGIMDHKPQPHWLIFNLHHCHKNITFNSFFRWLSFNNRAILLLTHSTILCRQEVAWEKSKPNYPD